MKGLSEGSSKTIKYILSSCGRQVISKMLSDRVQDILTPSPLFNALKLALGNAYHPTDNPDGIISLGIAENTLMYSDLAEFLNTNMFITPDLFGYGAVFPGSPSLRSALLRLYNSDPFNPSSSSRRQTYGIYRWMHCIIG